MFSAPIEHAIRTATQAHQGQTRKGTDLPYITHPLHVALILARTGADEVTIQSAVLHDVVEDCEGWTLERLEQEFGADVCETVAQLTEEKGASWQERKQAAIDHVPHMTERALQVKAADKLHNLSCLLADVRAADSPDDVFQHFTSTAEATLQMARGLVEALASRMDGELISSLAATLEDLEAASRG